MGSKWTDEQLLAITERGKNILVSAGAGSGKTAVMVERVVRLIMEDRVPVSAMLIVTFTKAAASEMKERLRKTLKDRLTEVSRTGEIAEQIWIKEQLDSLHTANISTFHSFAQQVLKEFFYFTDIEPGFRVLDEPEAEVLKEQAMDELFESEYEKDQPDFRAFLDSYSGEKNDNEARSLLLTVYRKMEAVPGRFEVLREKTEELQVDKDAFRESDIYRKLKEHLVSQIDESIQAAEKTAAFLREEGLPRLAGLVDEDRDMIELMKDSAEKDDTDNAVRIIRNTRFNRITTKGKEEKELYTEDVKDEMNFLREGYKKRLKDVQSLYYTDIDCMVRSMQLTYSHARTVRRLIEKFHEIFQGLKRDSNAIDYSDMEHYAYEILGHEEAREYYRDTFQYIFIDEYQDTNIMQETIISRIRRDDNMFMVGDIKQSIYHFRLADPEIFKDKYAKYKEEGLKGDAAESIKIDLNRNFRSKSLVLREVNNMFRPIMEGYDEDAELIPGAPDGAVLLGPPETHIIDTASIDEEDEEIRDLKDEEREAREAVRIIHDNLGKEYTDSKTGETKKIDYRDIVILMYSFRRSAEGYRHVFSEAGIPLYIDDESGYFDSIEINVFLSLLTVLDNKRQDIPFIALLRSEIFGFSCTELALIRKHHRKGSFVEAAEAAAVDEDIPENLRNKVREVFDRIKKWQAYAVTLPLPDLIWRLMNETGYYMIAGAMPNGAVRQANLRLLADRARDYSERALGSLYGFIKYIEQVKKNKVELPQATLLSENENLVRVMTIHHSKGLEYPVVIVAGMGARHKGTDSSEVEFDRTWGLGMRAVDPVDHLYETGLIARMIRAKEQKADSDEMKRVLYVAVTRARERFYLLGSGNYDQIIDKMEKRDTSDSTFFRMSGYLPGIVRVDPSELRETLVVAEKNEQDSDERSELTEEEKKALLRLDYEYPYSGAGSAAAKTTVTGLNKEGMKSSVNEAETEDGAPGRSLREIQDEEEAYQESISLINKEIPEFMKGIREVTASERGTAYHGVMERIDFARASEEGTRYISEKAAELEAAGVFTREEMDSVDPEKIRRFFDTPLGERACLAFKNGKLHREQTFELKIRKAGEDVLVQGVIDCYFEEDDGMVLLDYKTNYIDPKKPPEDEKKRLTEMYRTQLEIYAESIEKALGKKVKEKYLYLFAADQEVKVG